MPVCLHNRSKQCTCGGGFGTGTAQYECPYRPSLLDIANPCDLLRPITTKEGGRILDQVAQAPPDLSGVEPPDGFFRRRK
jgi:hypothetical protein